jgi:hypothetical protein
MSKMPGYASLLVAIPFLVYLETKQRPIYVVRREIAQWRHGNFRWRSPLGFGLISALLIPLGMVAAGKFPTYYA